MQETGLYLAFQTIFAELIGKNVPEEKHFGYTAKRLREYAKEIERIVKIMAFSQPWIVLANLCLFF
jgi:hypothetical protein